MLFHNGATPTYKQSLHGRYSPSIRENVGGKYQASGGTRINDVEHFIFFDSQGAQTVAAEDDDDGDHTRGARLRL